MPVFSIPDLTLSNYHDGSRVRAGDTVMPFLVVVDSNGKSASVRGAPFTVADTVPPVVSAQYAVEQTLGNYEFKPSAGTVTDDSSGTMKVYLVLALQTLTTESLRNIVASFPEGYSVVDVADYVRDTPVRLVDLALATSQVYDPAAAAFRQVREGDSVHAHVMARDPSGLFWSRSVFVDPVADRTPPTGLGGVAIGAVTSNSVMVTALGGIVDGGDGVSNVTLHYGTSSTIDAGTETVTFAPGSAYNISGLDDATVYYVWVSATDGTNVSGPVLVGSARTLDSTDPVIASFDVAPSAPYTFTASTGTVSDNASGPLKAYLVMATEPMSTASLSAVSGSVEPSAKNESVAYTSGTSLNISTIGLSTTEYWTGTAFASITETSPASPHRLHAHILVLDASGNDNSAANPGAAKTVADSTPPRFSGTVTLAASGPDAVTVSWDAGVTDGRGLASASVYYSAAAPASSSVADVAAWKAAAGTSNRAITGLIASGTVEVTGLTSATTYYAYLCATDSSGNVANFVTSPASVATENDAPAFEYYGDYTGSVVTTGPVFSPPVTGGSRASSTFAKDADQLYMSATSGSQSGSAAGPASLLQYDHAAGAFVNLGTTPKTNTGVGLGYRSHGVALVGDTPYVVERYNDTRDATMPMAHVVHRYVGGAFQQVGAAFGADGFGAAFDHGTVLIKHDRAGDRLYVGYIVAGGSPKILYIASPGSATSSTAWTSLTLSGAAASVTDFYFAFAPSGLMWLLMIVGNQFAAYTVAVSGSSGAATVKRAMGSLSGPTYTVYENWSGFVSVYDDNNVAMSVGLRGGSVVLVVNGLFVYPTALPESASMGLYHGADTVAHDAFGNVYAIVPQGGSVHKYSRTTNGWSQISTTFTALGNWGVLAVSNNNGDIVAAGQNGTNFAYRVIRPTTVFMVENQFAVNSYRELPEAYNGEGPDHIKEVYDSLSLSRVQNVVSSPDKTIIVWCDTASTGTVNHFGWRNVDMYYFYMFPTTSTLRLSYNSPGVKPNLDYGPGYRSDYNFKNIFLAFTEKADGTVKLYSNLSGALGTGPPPTDNHTNPPPGPDIVLYHTGTAASMGSPNGLMNFGSLGAAEFYFQFSSSVHWKDVMFVPRELTLAEIQSCYDRPRHVVDIQGQSVVRHKNVITKSSNSEDRIGIPLCMTGKAYFEFDGENIGMEDFCWGIAETTRLPLATFLGGEVSDSRGLSASYTLTRQSVLHKNVVGYITGLPNLVTATNVPNVAGFVQARQTYCLAIDYNAGKVWWGLNGNYGGYDPVTGTTTVNGRTAQVQPGDNVNISRMRYAVIRPYHGISKLYLKKVFQYTPQGYTEYKTYDTDESVGLKYAPAPNLNALRAANPSILINGVTSITPEGILIGDNHDARVSRLIGPATSVTFYMRLKVPRGEGGIHNTQMDIYGGTSHAYSVFQEVLYIGGPLGQPSYSAQGGYTVVPTFTDTSVRVLDIYFSYRGTNQIFVKYVDAETKSVIVEQVATRSTNPFAGMTYFGFGLKRWWDLYDFAVYTPAI